jgi:hypothetical protein
MRAGCVLHSLEFFECRVVGKCCSNVLPSLCAYGVVPKAVRTHRHDREQNHTHSNTNTRDVYLHAVHTMHIQLYSCEQAVYCTHVSIWSVELWASAAAMCCAPSVPMEFWLRLYAQEYVRRTIQCTCVAHDARSHTHSRVRGHIHICIRACRHTKYKHVCMLCTYTYLHSSAQRDSIYHAQTYPTSTHSCE